MTAPSPYGGEAPPPAVDGTASLLIMMARLEGKVDVALAQQGAKTDEHGRRLDALETQRDADDARLRAVEQKATVTPRAMLAALAAFAAIVAALTPFLDRLYS